MEEQLTKYFGSLFPVLKTKSSYKKRAGAGGINNLNAQFFRIIIPSTYDRFTERLSFDSNDLKVLINYLVNAFIVMQNGERTNNVPENNIRFILGDALFDEPQLINIAAGLVGTNNTNEIELDYIFYDGTYYAIPSEIQTPEQLVEAVARQIRTVFNTEQLAEDLEPLLVRFRNIIRPIAPRDQGQNAPAQDLNEFEIDLGEELNFPEFEVTEEEMQEAANQLLNEEIREEIKQEEPEIVIGITTDKGDFASFRPPEDPDREELESLINEQNPIEQRISNQDFQKYMSDEEFTQFREEIIREALRTYRGTLLPSLQNFQRLDLYTIESTVENVINLLNNRTIMQISLLSGFSAIALSPLIVNYITEKSVKIIMELLGYFTTENGEKIILNGKIIEPISTQTFEDVYKGIKQYSFSIPTIFTSQQTASVSWDVYDDVYDFYEDNVQTKTEYTTLTRYNIKYDMNLFTNEQINNEKELLKNLDDPNIYKIIDIDIAALKNPDNWIPLRNFICQFLTAQYSEKEPNALLTELNFMTGDLNNDNEFSITSTDNEIKNSGKAFLFTTYSGLVYIIVGLTYYLMSPYLAFIKSASASTTALIFIIKMAIAIKFIYYVISIIGLPVPDVLQNVSDAFDNTFSFFAHFASYIVKALSIPGLPKLLLLGGLIAAGVFAYKSLTRMTHGVRLPK